MTRVLVVCKTKMRSELCIGGLALDDNILIRLLTADGSNQPTGSDFEVGALWECELVPKRFKNRPHTEDMQVTPKRFLRVLPDARELIIDRLDLETSRKRTLLDGLVQYTRTGSGYICERTGVPGYAHAFWRPIYGFRLSKEYDKIYYIYEGPSKRKFRLPYVGLAPPVSRLAPGSLLHLSLARWWRQRRNIEKRCYLQLSGWFL